MMKLIWRLFGYRIETMADAEAVTKPPRPMVCMQLNRELTSEEKDEFLAAWKTGGIDGGMASLPRDAVTFGNIGVVVPGTGA